MFQSAYAGEFLKDYEPKININTVINYFLARPVVLHTSALITQEVQFPDVSFYQKEINYAIMSTKTRAIIIRAGQNRWVDEQFERNYAEAKRTGLLVGVYWFFDGRVSPQEQAALLISILRGKILELEVYIDWERNYGGQHEGLPNVVAMMQLVEAAGLQIKGIGLYTGYYFFRGNSNAISNAGQYSYLRTKPLWLAWYAIAANVLIPAPWTELTHWQFGTPVVQWGQQTAELDMNFFNGTRMEFDQRYINGVAMQIIKGTATATVNIRSLPGGNILNPARYLVPGDQIEADRNQYQWLHLTKINGVAVVGEQWASAGSTQQYITWQWVALPDEPPPPPVEPIPTHTIRIYPDGKISVDGGTPY